MTLLITNWIKTTHNFSRAKHEQIEKNINYVNYNKYVTLSDALFFIFSFFAVTVLLYVVAIYDLCAFCRLRHKKSADMIFANMCNWM